MPRTVPEDQFLEEVLKEVASILPEHEAKLVYPGDGALGPVSAGRTRKTGIQPAIGSRACREGQRAWQATHGGAVANQEVTLRFQEVTLRFRERHVSP